KVSDRIQVGIAGVIVGGPADEDVFPPGTGEGVRAGAADQDRAAAAEDGQLVIAAHAHQDVVAADAPQDIGIGVAPEEVIALAAGDGGDADPPAAHAGGGAGRQVHGDAGGVVRVVQVIRAAGPVDNARNVPAAKETGRGEPEDVHRKPAHQVLDA